MVKIYVTLSSGEKHASLHFRSWARRETKRWKLYRLPQLRGTSLLGHSRQAAFTLCNYRVHHWLVSCAHTAHLPLETRYYYRTVITAPLSVLSSTSLLPATVIVLLSRAGSLELLNIFKAFAASLDFVAPNPKHFIAAAGPITE